MLAAVLLGLACIVGWVHIRGGNSEASTPPHQRAWRWTWGVALADSLERGGWAFGVDRFIGLIASATAAVVAGAFWLTGSSLVVLVCAAAPLGLAHSYVRHGERRYVSRLESQLPIVAQQLAGGVGAGLSLRHAVERASRDLPEPSRTEIGRVTDDLRLGADVDSALDGVLARIESPAMAVLIATIAVQRTVGGNLAEALTQISRRLDERTRLTREAQSATVQARMSAWLVAGLPAAAGFLTELVAPGTLRHTLGRGAGMGVLAVAITLQVVGVLVIRRITSHVGGVVR